MYSKCDCHITAFENAFDNVKKILKNLNVIKKKYKFYIKNDMPAIPIDENSTVGQQIKHYRQIKGIHQKDIAKYVNIDRYTMHQIENYEYKQIKNPKYVQKIIDFLDIKIKLIGMINT